MVNHLRKIQYQDMNETTASSAITSFTGRLALVIRERIDRSWETFMSVLQIGSANRSGWRAAFRRAASMQATRTVAVTSASPVALHALVEHQLGATQRIDRARDVQHVVEPRRLQVFDLQRSDSKGDAAFRGQ